MDPSACPSCGQPIDDAGKPSCPACGATLGAGGGSSGAPPPPANSVPFEDTSQPFTQRLFRTAGLAFTNPTQLFGNMTQDDISLPLLYGVIVGTVGSAISILWNLLFGGLFALGGASELEEFAIGTGFYLLMMALSPLFAVVGLFVSSGIYHLALLILGDGQRGFSVTFRAVAYGNTPVVLGVVPFCGGLVGGIWVVVLAIIGGKLGHGTDWWRAILAYFLPTILCCCLIVWLAMTFGLLGAVAD